MEWLIEFANERPVLLAKYTVYAIAGAAAVLLTYLNRRREKIPVSKKISNSYQALAKLLITDQTALKQLNGCFSDYKKYYSTHQSQYQARGIEDAGDQEAILWFAIVDCLLEHHLAVEVDWNEDPSVVADLLNQTIKNKPLKIDREWFSSDHQSKSFKGLNSKWNAQNMVLAELDLDSDSYVFAPLSTDQFEKTKDLAANLGRTIDYAISL